MGVPKTVEIIVAQHIGAPCLPTVKVGDEVKVGQIIADSDKFVSAPIHSSVSGKVKSIGDFTPSGDPSPEHPQQRERVVKISR